MKLEVRKLRPLVGVEDLGRSVPCDRFLEGLDTEVGGQAVRDPRAQDFAAEPVHDGDQIHEAALHRDVGHVGRPHLVGPIDHEFAQQVRIDRMTRMSPAGVRSSVQRRDPHRSHQRRDVPAADADALEPLDVAQHAAAQERPLEVQLIGPAHQLKIRSRGGYGLVIQRGARELQQLRLARQAKFVLWIDHRLALDPGSRPSAPAKKSFSSDNCPILACSVLMSGPGSVAAPAPSNTAEARSAYSADLERRFHVNVNSARWVSDWLEQTVTNSGGAMVIREAL